MKKLLFAAFAALLSFCVQAQEIDSVHVEVAYPGLTYVRIKFPHDGFRLTRYLQADFNSYPPWKSIIFWFKECTGTPGVTYYDTTMTQYVTPDNYITMDLVLDSNTWDTNCVLRPSRVVVDTLVINYFTPPTSVKNKEMGSIGLYPNPIINHRLIIETDASGSKPTVATLYSLQGSKIAAYTLSEAKAEIILPPHLPAGNYLLFLQTADGSTERKLITVQ